MDSRQKNAGMTMLLGGDVIPEFFYRGSRGGGANKMIGFVNGYFILCFSTDAFAT